MRSWTVVLGLAAAMAVAAPRAARACAYGGGGGGGGSDPYVALAVAALAIGVVDTGLTLWDSGSALTSHQPSRGYGVFELIFAAPQAALGGYGLYKQLSSPYGGDRNTVGYTAGYTIWMSLLTAHAIWTIARSPAAPEPPADLEESAARASHSTPTVALAPTYVP